MGVLGFLSLRYGYHLTPFEIAVRMSGTTTTFHAIDAKVRTYLHQRRR